jgi:hypothetical protein
MNSDQFVEFVRHNRGRVEEALLASDVLSDLQSTRKTVDKDTRHGLPSLDH